MNEVPAILYGFMRDTLKRAGVDITRSADGLKLRNARADRLGDRVDWDELAIFLNRCSEGLSPTEQDRIGELYVRVNRYLQLVVGLAIPPSTLFRSVWRASRSAFPHISFPLKEISDGRLDLEMVLPDAYEPCPFFFRSTAGELRALPRLLGLPDADVELETRERYGRYLVRLPRSKMQFDRGSSAGWTSGERLTQELLRLIEWGFAPPRAAGESPSSVLRRDYGLTKAECRVATRIADGRTVAEIAEDLSVSAATVRTQLKSVFSKTDTHRQAELVRLVLSLREGTVPNSLLEPRHSAR